MCTKDALVDGEMMVMMIKGTLHKRKPQGKDKEHMIRMVIKDIMGSWSASSLSNNVSTFPPPQPFRRSLFFFLVSTECGKRLSPG